MQINAIFAIVNNSLLSVQFDNEDYDEFSLLFDKWNDVEFLEDFFEKNKTDLQNGFFGNITIEEAVIQTIEEAKKLENHIISIAKKGTKNNEETRLDLVFSPLQKYEFSTEHVQSKAYGSVKHSWLRLYAIRIAENLYVVSGGAIKLTQTMNDRDHLQKELLKLKITQKYLKEIQLLDEDDYQYIEISNHE